MLIYKIDARETLDPLIAESLRRMTPREKLAMIFKANQFARSLSAAGVRVIHPDWTTEQVEAEVARRCLSAATRPDGIAR